MAVNRIGMARALSGQGGQQNIAVQRTPILPVTSQYSDPAGQLAFGQGLVNKAINGQGFDPQGGIGVAAAQIATAGIGAWAQNRARKEIAEKEAASQQQFSSYLSEKGYTPESVAAISASTSPESRSSIIQEFIKQDIKAQNPEAQTSLAKLGADYKAGLIDESTYRSALKKETSFAPDSNSRGGATGAIIDNLMRENPRLTYAQALAQAQGLARQGMTYDADSNVVPLAGYAESKSNLASSQAYATEKGKQTGETAVNLEQQQAALPTLMTTVDKLGKLGEIATYTKTGQARDTALRELGLPVTKGANARAEYIATVDNQVLPLLRQTFGAAFTQKEGESLKATLGDPNKSPSEKDAMLKSFITQKQANIATTQRELQGLSNSQSGAAPANQPQDLKSKYGLK